MSDKLSFWRVWALCSGLAVLMPLIIDIYLPAIPSIAKYYHVDVSDIQVTLASLNIGVAIGQIIYGPLADRFGRRKVLLISMILFTSSSFLIVLAPSVEIHNFLRFLQGITAASGMIVARAIIRDLYDGSEATKLLAYIYVSGSIMPIAAPIIGGYVTDYFGWKPNFHIIGVIGLILTLSLFHFLKETGKKDAQALKISEIGTSFLDLCKSKMFLTYTLIGLGPFVGLFAILTSLSTILISFLGVTPTTFGYLFAAIMLGNLAASALAGRLATALGNTILIWIGCSICLVSGFGAFYFSWFTNPTPIGIVLPSASFMIGFALTIPPTTVNAMSPFPEIAGRASSLIGLAHFSAAAVTSLLIGIFSDGTDATLGIALLIAGIISIISLWPLFKQKNLLT